MNGERIYTFDLSNNGLQQIKCAILLSQFFDFCGFHMLKW
jgi:hypothetical protein